MSIIIIRIVKLWHHRQYKSSLVEMMVGVKAFLSMNQLQVIVVNMLLTETHKLSLDYVKLDVK
jgi:hypothetical protein